LNRGGQKLQGVEIFNIIGVVGVPNGEVVVGGDDIEAGSMLVDKVDLLIVLAVGPHLVFPYLLFLVGVGLYVYCLLVLYRLQVQSHDFPELPCQN
jgi:hypothetical protein